ncbi:MAG: hypothetical protein RL571_2876 [Pseudomonadota bacterium]
MYEERFVVFLDLLGFKNEIFQSENDADKFKKIYDFLTRYSSESHAREVFKGIKTYSEEISYDQSIKDLAEMYPYSFTQCSDSFVFSVNISESQSFTLLLLLIGQFIYDALEVGFLVRGGLAFGRMIHIENGPMFGPAFNEAYNIESKQAGYPRVLLCTEAFLKFKEIAPDCVDWIDEDRKEINIANFINNRYRNIEYGNNKKIRRDELYKAIYCLDKLKEGRVSQSKIKENPSNEKINVCVDEKYAYVEKILRDELNKSSGLS